MILILKIFTPFIAQIMILLSLLLVFRGHNHPGGGFIGGLIATSAIALYVLAKHKHARSFHRLAILAIILGIIFLILGMMIGVYFANPIFTGVWVTFDMKLLQFKIGTPLLFDLGVYFIVYGSLSWLLINLEESSYDYLNNYDRYGD